MIYYFEGVERIQLMFDSPNKLAAFVCMLIPFAVFFVVRCPLRNRWWRMAFISLCVTCLILEGVLVHTYSRGGFVAFAISMAVLYWCGLRKWSMMICGGLGVLMMIIPKAVVRAVEVNPISDLSIWHRLLLWKGVCGISVNSFPFGVGRDVGPVIMAWYQVLDKHQPYLTAVSDPLTIAARYGLPVLFVILLFVSAVFFALVDYARRRRLPFPAAIAASGVSFLVAGAFSTFYTTPLLISGFAVVFVVATAHMIWTDCRCRLKTLAKALTVSMSVCLAIYFVGAWVIRVNPIRFEYSSRCDSDSCYVWMDGERCRGVIVYLFDRTETSLDAEGRQSVRPFLKEEWPIFMLGVEPDAEGLARARNELKTIEARYPLASVRLIGQNCGGRFALILASESNRVDRVASIGAAASWPIRAMSPVDTLCCKSNLVVKVVNGGADWHTNPQEAMMIKRKCEEEGIACDVRIESDVGNRLDEKRSDVLSELVAWLSER